MNIGIKLFEHNQTAFNSVLEMLAETSKEFAEFKKDNSNHLKLSYAIDMLNERHSFK